MRKTLHFYLKIHTIFVWMEGTTPHRPRGRRPPALFGSSVNSQSVDLCLRSILTTRFHWRVSDRGCRVSAVIISTRQTDGQARPVKRCWSMSRCILVTATKRIRQQLSISILSLPLSASSQDTITPPSASCVCVCTAANF